VKASLELTERKPGGGETQEGIGLEHRLTPGVWVADSDAEQSPEGEDRRSGAGGQLPVAKSGQRREGNGR